MTALLAIWKNSGQWVYYCFAWLVLSQTYLCRYEKNIVLEFDDDGITSFLFSPPIHQEPIKHDGEISYTDWQECDVHLEICPALESQAIMEYKLEEDNPLYLKNWQDNPDIMCRD